VPPFRFRRKSDLRNDAERVLGVVGVHRGSQVFKPTSRGLISDCPVTRLNAGFPIIVVCGAGRPVNKVAAELGSKLADGFVAKEVVEIE
jgi:hypothetical protein